MAIAWARVRYVKRSQGRSAVAAAAYQSRTLMIDQRTGEPHDGTKHEPIEAHQVMLPNGADESLRPAEVLWNAHEQVERRRNSQTAKELLLGLPKELDLPHRIELATSFVYEHIVSKGIAAQLDFHAPHDGGDNYHCHVLFGTRRIEGSWFAKLKARDLEPKVRPSRFGGVAVVEAELWNQRWREHQDRYFRVHKLDLIVDPQAIHPLNRDFGPRRKWGVHTQDIIDQRRELNAKLARHPHLIWETLRRTQQHFDGRALERFLSKHVDDESERQDIKRRVELLKHEALQQAQKVDRVPSGWRPLTVEDIARQLSPKYAQHLDKAKRFREFLRKADHVVNDRSVAVENADHLLQQRLNQMGFLRRIAHHTQISLLCDLETDTLNKYRETNQRTLTKWTELRRFAAHKLDIQVRAANEVLDFTSAGEPTLRQRAEAELQQRQKISLSARLILSQTQKAHAMTLHPTHRHGQSITPR